MLFRSKLRWWNQEVPHDLWDYDAAAPVIFMDARDSHGKLVPAAAQAGKVGNVFIVNRETGERLRKSDPFVPQSASLFQVPPENGSVTIYPASNGGSQWSPAAFSPRTRDFYVIPGISTGVGANFTTYTIPEGLQAAYGQRPVAVMMFMRFKLRDY